MAHRPYDVNPVRLPTASARILSYFPTFIIEFALLLRKNF